MFRSALHLVPRDPTPTSIELQSSIKLLFKWAHEEFSQENLFQVTPSPFHFPPPTRASPLPSFPLCPSVRSVQENACGAPSNCPSKWLMRSPFRKTYPRCVSYLWPQDTSPEVLMFSQVGFCMYQWRTKNGKSQLQHFVRGLRVGYVACSRMAGDSWRTLQPLCYWFLLVRRPKNCCKSCYSYTRQAHKAWAHQAACI